MEFNNHYVYKNLPLPYAYEALEPYIDTKTMMLHHDKHLQTYIDNLNKAIQPYKEYHNWPLERLLYYVNILPKEIQTSVSHNGGGVYNHRFYFDGMTPNSLGKPVGNLKEKINEEYGSFETFKNDFKEAALSVFGSGYAWLVLTCHDNLKIMITKNQETLIGKPVMSILTIDVWEHAYYLKHYNKRVNYIDDWFSVVD